ncbi:MAG TPA: hypothetical protein VIG80_12000 [Bacillaceae bacterium]
MNFKKSFNTGYLVYLLGLIVMYFTFPADRMFPVLLTLTILFGLYQFIFFYKHYRNQKGKVS